VWFVYTPDRKGEHPKANLSRFAGTLEADAYVGFGQLYESERIREAGCWAHMRRKFYDLYVAHNRRWLKKRSSASANSMPSKKTSADAFPRNAAPCATSAAVRCWSR
jgi:transposase IS66 family protein